MFCVLLFLPGMQVLEVTVSHWCCSCSECCCPSAGADGSGYKPQTLQPSLPDLINTDVDTSFDP